MNICENTHIQFLLTWFNIIKLKKNTIEGCSAMKTYLQIFKKHWLLSTALVYEPKYDIRLRNYLFSRLQHHLMLQIGTTKSFLQDSVSLVHSDLACNWENTEIKVNNSFLFFSLLTYLHFLRKIFNFRENILKMKPLLPPPAAAASG